MKWDAKHDRAKKVIDFFMENATGYWQEVEMLTEGLNDEEKELVSQEVNLMVSSIRKRYKLQERLTEKAAQIQPKNSQTVKSTERTEETEYEALKEPETVEQATEEVPKPKRARKKHRREENSGKKTES